MKIAENDVGIVRPWVEIDAGSDRAEVAESLHFGADPCPEAEHGSVAPIDAEGGEPVTKDASKFSVVVPELMGLEFCCLVFQVIGVGSVATSLKIVIVRVPFVAKPAPQEALPERALEAIEGAHVLCVERSDPVSLQPRSQLREMRMVACLDGAKDMNCGNIRAGESTIVHHLLDAGAGGSDLRGEISQAAWAIADDGGESAEPAVGNESPFHDAAEHVWIDVAATEQQDHALSFEIVQLTGKTGSQRRRGRTFDHTLFEFDNAEDRKCDLF